MTKRRNKRRRVRRGRKRTASVLIKGSVLPTMNTASPWNELTVTTFWTSGGKDGIICINLDEVRGIIVKELGLYKNTPIDLRYMRVDLWSDPIITASENFIVLAPCDWTRVNLCPLPSVLEWFEIWGTVTIPAHLHYVWPQSISQTVMPSGTNNVLFQLDCTRYCRYIMKHHVMWRPNLPDPRPTIERGIMLSIRHRFPSPPDSCILTLRTSACLS